MVKNQKRVWKFNRIPDKPGCGIKSPEKITAKGISRKQIGSKENYEGPQNRDRFDFKNKVNAEKGEKGQGTRFLC
jgi:hypothetical protein